MYSSVQGGFRIPASSEISSPATRIYIYVRSVLESKPPPGFFYLVSWSLLTLPRWVSCLLLESAYFLIHAWSVSSEPVPPTGLGAEDS